MQIRGGSSKGLYFLASDLPENPAAREQLLLDIVGRDERQIDGLGGADPLTSKVAIVSLSDHADVDVDYLFVQVVVGAERIDTTPNCGNILAGVGAFALEQGLISAGPSTTRVRVRMLNSNTLCELVMQTPAGQLTYEGSARIDGVPGTAAPVYCNYLDVAGGVCGALYPTGRVVDTIDGITVTCVDNGMPVVVMLAEELDVTGYESPQTLEENTQLTARIEAIRLQAGRMMNLGDVRDKAVPKMCLLSAPRCGGIVNTRTFIPRKCHTAIGVLGAVSVATVCITSDAVAHSLVDANALTPGDLSIEHPSGEFTVALTVAGHTDQGPTITEAGVLRTARLLAKGEAYVNNRTKNQ